MAAHGPKHKLCRRVGHCVWDMPKCPSAKRPVPAGPHGKTANQKLSTYGKLLREKQKLRSHYALTEVQLRFLYQKSQAGQAKDGDRLLTVGEKLIRNLELRLASVVFRSGLAPTIFAAKQAVIHGHVLVDGKKIDRNGYRVRAGQVVSVNPERSPKVAEIAQKSNAVIPAYLEVDKPNCKVTVLHEPSLSEVPVTRGEAVQVQRPTGRDRDRDAAPKMVPCHVDIMSVIEFYAR